MVALTGIWNGLYSFPELMPPVCFVATLLETEAWVSGTTHETVAEYGVLYAQLIGQRSGDLVSFNKTYQDAPPGYRLVSYSGTVNADATEISGFWIVPGAWSGTFVMTRPKGAEPAVEREILETVRG